MLHTFFVKYVVKIWPYYAEIGYFPQIKTVAKIKKKNQEVFLIPVYPTPIDIDFQPYQDLGLILKECLNADIIIFVAVPSVEMPRMM